MSPRPSYEEGRGLTDGAIVKSVRLIKNRSVAQLAEHRPFKTGVPSSNLGRST